jgi:hypothetical protein
VELPRDRAELAESWRHRGLLHAEPAGAPRARAMLSPAGLRRFPASGYGTVTRGHVCHHATPAMPATQRHI